MEEFLKEVRDIFDDQTIEFDTDLTELERWNSLVFMLLMGLIRNKYQKQVDIKKIMRQKSVRDLYKLINEE